jgi:hypothetical protein
MSRKKSNAAPAAIETDEQEEKLKLVPPTEAADDTDADDGDDEAVEKLPPPVRASNDLLPSTEAAGSTITKATANELKNFLATADFIQRQIAVQLADLWPDITRTAELISQESKGDKPAKVGLSAGITIDLTNLEIMEASIKLGFNRKYSRKATTQEDLTQTKFALVLQAQGASE